MKGAWLFAAAIACHHGDPARELAHQAHELAHAHDTELAGLVARIDGVKRDLRGNRPGWEQMLRTAQLANDGLGLPPFEQSVPPGPRWKPSPASLLGIGPYVEARADELAAHGQLDQLRFLIDDARRRYDRGIAEVAQRLGELEASLRGSAAQP